MAEIKARHRLITDASLLAIGIEPMVVKAVAAIRAHAKSKPESEPESKLPTARLGTKQALLIAMIQEPEGATMEEITAATGWQAYRKGG